jgi:hypothetical protein
MWVDGTEFRWSNRTTAVVAQAAWTADSADKKFNGVLLRQEGVFTGTMGEVSLLRQKTLPRIIGKDAPKIEPRHPSNPIMRRLRADLEEKHEPPGTLSAKAEPNRKKSEMKLK